MFKTVKLFALPALILAFCLPPCGVAQALYSFVDDSGVRVYTNVPPKSPMKDLKVTGVPLPPPPPRLTMETPYDSIIEKYASRYNIAPGLIQSMIAKESEFNPRAVSNKGAQGLMQLMPGTASRLGVRNVFDPDENIRGGTAHMRSLLDAFNNDLELSLAAYNAGENLVQRIGRVPNIKETNDYVRVITKKYGKKDVTYQNTAAPPPPTAYKWTDGEGVLHFSNTPPTDHIEPSLPLLLDASNSPQ